MWTSSAGAALDMWSNIGPVAEFVLLVLLIFSIVSWTIIFSKWAQLRRERRFCGGFLRVLHRAGRLSEVHAVVDSYSPSLATAVFEAGYKELERQVGTSGSRNLSAVQRVLQAESADQQSELEQRLSWLATTASASPFIGLFGTVWGIIDAFHALGSEGAATLRVVAPGVAEALVTTAAGLFVAIPALITYNQFMYRLRQLAVAGDELTMEFTTRAEEIIRAPRSDAGSVGAR